MTVLGWTFFTFCVVTLSFAFMFRRYGKFWLISIPSTFMFIYTIFNVIGSPFLLKNLQLFEIKFIVAMNLGILMHLLGFILADHVFNFNFRKEMKCYLDKPKLDNWNVINKLIFVIIVLIVITISMIYLMKVPSIPLKDLFFSDNKVLEIAKSRELATTSFAGKYHRYSFFFRIILPFLSLASLAAAFQKKDFFWKTAFGFLFLFSVFMQIVDLQKSPVLFYLISVVFLYFILNKKVDFKKMFITILFFIIILIIMYSTIMGLSERGTGYVMQIIVRRLFISQTLGNYTAFRVIPIKQDFLFGLSFPNPAGIFPFEHFEVIKFIFNETYGYGRFIVGTAPTPYFIEFYMNFGYFAMIISMLLGAFLIQTIQIVLLRSKKSILNLGLYSILLVTIGKMGLTSIFDCMGLNFFFLLLFIRIFNLTINTVKGIRFENYSFSNE